MKKKIIFVLRFVILGWWLIPLLWVGCFPISYLLSGGDTKATIKELTVFTKDLFWGC